MMERKKGFTLIELLVYIVLAFIVVGIAGQAFVDTAALRLRTTRLLEASMGTDDVVDCLNEDIRRMGAKAWMRSSSSGSSSSGSSSSASPLMPKLNAVYWDLAATVPDSSSFTATAQGSGAHRLDLLEFRTGIYNDVGEITGYEQIRYHVENEVLWRTVVGRFNLAGTVLTPLPDSVRMAEHVVAFKLRYGLQAGDSVVFDRLIKEPCVATSPESACLVQYAGSSASVSGYAGMPQISDLPFGSMASFKLVKGGSPLTVDAFTVKPGFTYKVELGMGSNDSAAVHYRSDRDYISVGVSPSANPGTDLSGTNRTLLYPALQTGIIPRAFSFSTNALGSSASASFALHFQLRSSSSAVSSSSSSSGTQGVAAAAFRFERIKVRQVGTDAYQWIDDFSSLPVRDKARIRAVEMTISIQGNSAVSTATKVIPVLNNGV